MKSVIIDPDKASRKKIETILRESEQFDPIVLCSTPAQAIKAVLNNHIDVIFIDMQMPGMDGMGFLNELSYSRPHIIALADKKEAAADAFEFEASDFILKPIDSTRLMKAIARILRRDSRFPSLKNRNGSDLFLRVDGNIVRVRLKDVSYLEAMGDYVSIMVGDKKRTVYSTLKGVLDYLPSSDFMRVHKSYVVRLDKIESIHDSVITVGRTKIPVSITYHQALMDRLKIVPPNK
jgi:DNA-binding LytR/AlgR family response regulator